MRLAETRELMISFQIYLMEHQFGRGDICQNCGISIKYLKDLFFDADTNAMPYCRNKEQLEELMELHSWVADKAEYDYWDRR